MLLNILTRYLDNIEHSILRVENAYIEHYEEEIFGGNRANLRIRIRFSNGYLLELNEAVLVEKEEIQHLHYRYHFQDRDNNLIFRYDNTPHFPHPLSYPHHKHLAEQVVPTENILIPGVIEEVLHFLEAK